MRDDNLTSVDGDISESTRLDCETFKLQVISRCKSASIKCEDASFEDASNVHNVLRVSMRSGRDSVPIYCGGADGLRRFLSIDFERYVLFREYHAICSYDLGVIEAGLQHLGADSPASILDERFDLADDENENALAPPLDTVRVVDASTSVALSISTASREFSILCRSYQLENNIPDEERFEFPTLRIENASITTYEDAVATLERLANSFFFQLDLARNVPVTLARRWRIHRSVPQRQTENRIDFEFPRNEYDAAPLSLYWYGRGAELMPLLQFLAYYQAIEFYFPVYSQAEAQRKIRIILNDPAFRSDRDADLARIRSMLQSSAYGFGDERTQLHATFQECLEPTALRTFVTATDERVNFFTSKTEGISDKRLSIKNPDTDLRNEVADRIYDIRCKIVHTKSGTRDGGIDLLLPFSREADLLFTDIELIQYAAQQVLIAGSTPLSI